MDLPKYLASALEIEVISRSPRELARAAADLSTRYRDNSSRSERALLRTSADVDAYAAYRLPATFAAIHAALLAVRERRRGWQPTTLLDVGSGPGTAAWAAVELWPDFDRVTLLDRDDRMIDLGKRLARHAPSFAMQSATWLRTDVSRQWEGATHELVIAAYVLGELPAARRSDLAERLWSVAADTLVIVEPGTPTGFELVRQARDQLREAGALTLAPCPHNDACPMGADDWCHFAQRVTRTPLHRRIKAGALPFEDEKFSYAALSHHEGSPIAGRVLRHPQIRRGHIQLEVCTPEGLERRVVTRRDPGAFRQARKTRWGSALLADKP
jgi:ribosomal protein RSM22 (predicted rRNA methylase)